VAVAMKPDRRPRHKLLSASSSAYRKARIESSGLDHAAVIEGDGASTHTTNELAIVRGHDNGRASRVDFTEQVHDVEREIGVEVARRLIGQHDRSEVHTSELQSRGHLVCRLLLEKKNGGGAFGMCAA